MKKKRFFTLILIIFSSISLLLVSCPTGTESEKEISIIPSGKEFIITLNNEHNEPIKFNKSSADMTGSFRIEPDLPKGMDIDEETGEISGIPLEVVKETNYTVFFTGTGDYEGQNAKVTLKISFVKYSIKTDISDFKAILGKPLNPTITFNKIPYDVNGTFSIKPSLPEGLEINEETGEISGVPSEISPEKEYTVSFIGEGDFKEKETSTIIKLAVDDFFMSTRQVNNKFYVNNPIEPIVFEKNPPETKGKFSIEPQLPDDLDLNTSTGEISGIPKSPLELTTYTVRFNGEEADQGKNAELTLQIAIVDFMISPNESADSYLLINTAITPLTFQILPADAKGQFNIEPNLPDGLDLNTSTGEISGTPTRLSTQTAYTVKFTGEGEYQGKIAETSITIEVYEFTITPSEDEFIVLVDSQFSIPLTFEISPSDAIGTFSIDNKPEWLSIDESSGSISVNPAGLTYPKTNYTVRFQGTGKHQGMDTTTIISITSERLRITPNETDIDVVINEEMTAITFSIIPSNVQGTFSVNTQNPLPNNLSINPDTGEISGIPKEYKSDNEYEIEFNARGIYNGSSADTMVEITTVSRSNYPHGQFGGFEGFSYSWPDNLRRDNKTIRRDPSDVIFADGYYYVYYSYDPHPFTSGREGYNADIAVARSVEGKIWQELGIVVEKGGLGKYPDEKDWKKRVWDAHSAFTPNILVDDYDNDGNNEYYLTYTGLRRNNKGRTHIGMAVAESPRGPFTKVSTNPLISPFNDGTPEIYDVRATIAPGATSNGDTSGIFDSRRVDDSAFMIRNVGGEKQYWMYYKGGPENHWHSTQGGTKMGVAIATNPTGPYVKHENNPILETGHEVHVFGYGRGVAAITSKQRHHTIPRGLWYAEDGLDFDRVLHIEPDVPRAMGSYDPDRFTQSSNASGVTWGISMVYGRPTGYLRRWDADLTKKDMIYSLPLTFDFNNGKSLGWGASYVGSDGQKDTFKVVENSEGEKYYRQQEDTGPKKSFVGSSLWDDYILEVDITPTNFSNQNAAVFGVQFRNAFNGSNYAFYLGHEGSSNRHKMFLYRKHVAQGRLQSNKLRMKDYRLGAYNTTYNIKIELKGTLIKIYINDRLEIEYDDTSSHAILSGYIGLLTYNAAANFDNVKISSIE